MEVHTYQRGMRDRATTVLKKLSGSAALQRSESGTPMELVVKEIEFRMIDDDETKNNFIFWIRILILCLLLTDKLQKYTHIKYFIVNSQQYPLCVWTSLNMVEQLCSCDRHLQMTNSTSHGLWSWNNPFRYIIFLND